MKKLFCTMSVFLFLGGFLFPLINVVHAEESSVIVSEALWMGSDASGTDEYIELYNPSSESVDISGWRLTKFSGGQEKDMLTLPMASIIVANNYFLITNYAQDDERTALSVAPDVVDAAVSLSNATLQIKLYHGDRLVDVAGDGSAPLGGEYASGSVWRSMERVDGASDGSLASAWQSSVGSAGFREGSTVKGTPKAKNSTPLPEIIIDAPTVAVVGERVLFDASATAEKSGATLRLIWDFGDASGGEGSIVEHVYASAGTFTVRLHMSDDFQQDERTLNIAVAQAVEEKKVEKTTEEIIEEEAEIVEEVEEIHCDAGVRIHEVLPDPVGKDEESEFIELVHRGDAAVDLTDWWLADASGKKYRFQEGRMLMPGEYAVFPRDLTGIALNNSGIEHVELYCATGDIIDAMIFDAKKNVGQAIARDAKGVFVWTASPSPGSENVFLQPNNAPIAIINAPSVGFVGEEIVFSATDSEDQDGNTLSFAWEFADGGTDDGSVARKVFGSSGRYAVALTVSDGTSATRVSHYVVIVPGLDNKQGEIDKRQEPVGDSFVTDTSQYPFVRLHAFMPNPTGDDSAEWIEIENTSVETISLEGWLLDDADGGSKPYVFPQGFVIAGKEMLRVERAEIRIALNNAGDEVRLFAPSGEIIDATAYDNAEEGVARVRSGAGWVWDGVVVDTDEDQVSAPVVAQEIVADVFKEEDEGVSPLRIADVWQLAKDREVTIEGVVIMVPSVMSKQTMYVQDATGGIQIYQHDGLYPEVEVGSRVRVQGVVSEAYGEKRIKIAQNGVSVIGADGVLPEIAVACVDLPAYRSTRASVVGTIIDARSAEFLIEDKGCTVAVRLKNSNTAYVAVDGLQENQRVRVSGVVIVRNNDLYIVPKTVEILEDGADTQGGNEAIGAATQALAISSADVTNWLPYAIMGMGACVLLLSALYRKNIIQPLWQKKSSSPLLASSSLEEASLLLSTETPTHQKTAQKHPETQHSRTVPIKKVP